MIQTSNKNLIFPERSRGATFGLVIISLFIILYSLFLIPSLALAQPFSQPQCDNSKPNELCNPLNAGSITELFDKILNGLLLLSVPVVTIMILYGAYQIMSSAGEPAKIESGKKTILYTAIGFGIFLFAKVISIIISNILGGTK